MLTSYFSLILFFFFLLEELPELSQSFFGWVISLYNLTDEQILEHAGLDAYVVSKIMLSCLRTRPESRTFL